MCADMAICMHLVDIRLAHLAEQSQDLGLIVTDDSTSTRPVNSLSPS